MQTLRRCRRERTPSPPAMQRSMRTLILGAGALGGLIGARLAATGARVSFPVRDRASAERLRQAGFRVSGVGGSIAVPAGDVAALDDVPARTELELVVLATKAQEAMELAPRATRWLTPPTPSRRSRHSAHGSAAPPPELGDLVPVPAGGHRAPAARPRAGQVDEEDGATLVLALAEPPAVRPTEERDGLVGDEGQPLERIAGEQRLPLGTQLPRGAASPGHLVQHLAGPVRRPRPRQVGMDELVNRLAELPRDADRSGVAGDVRRGEAGGHQPASEILRPGQQLARDVLEPALQRRGQVERGVASPKPEPVPVRRLLRAILAGLHPPED